jgi:hypothetical protein
MPPVPMLERKEWQAALGSEPRRIYGLLAQAIAELYDRAARLLAIGDAAAGDDPLLGEERRRGHAATRADLLRVARALKDAGAIRRGVSVEHAADAMFALAANETTYLRLIDECGWSRTRYTSMLKRALEGALAP